MPVGSFEFQKAAKCVFAALLLSACSTKTWLLPSTDPNPSAKEQAREWLVEKRRVITIRIEPDLPMHDIQLKGSRTVGGGKIGAGKGALIALQAALEPSEIIEIVDNPVAILLVPFVVLAGAAVGASYGPTTEISETYHRSLEHVEGGAVIADAIEDDSDFIKLLTMEITKSIGNFDQHDLQIASENPEVVADEAMLIVTITTYAFAGDDKDDPDVQLYIGGKSRFWTPNRNGGFSCSWSYGSDRYKLRDWGKNDATLFRAELAQAGKAITSIIMSQIGANLKNCVGAGSFYLEANFLGANRDRIREHGEHLIENGDADEIYFVGQILLYRHEDKKEGYRFICHAAHRNHGEAQGLMGHGHQQYEEYENPLVPKDFIQAYKWYNLAISNGVQHFRESRDQLATHLTSADIAEAERLTAKWKPNPAECEFGQTQNKS